MLALARRMKIDDFVSRTLESCPHTNGGLGRSLPLGRLPSCSESGQQYSGKVQQPLRPAPI
jgi:hypothetical protein